MLGGTLGLWPKSTAPNSHVNVRLLCQSPRVQPNMVPVHAQSRCSRTRRESTTLAHRVIRLVYPQIQHVAILPSWSSTPSQAFAQCHAKVQTPSRHTTCRYHDLFMGRSQCQCIQPISWIPLITPTWCSYAWQEACCQARSLKLGWTSQNDTPVKGFCLHISRPNGLVPRAARFGQGGGGLRHPPTQDQGTHPGPPLL